jgi:uncharacterized protein YndB with AHSA1/START domain
LPRYAADRVLLAPLDDVWAFLAEPYHLSDWWPGIGGIEPDRRGLAPGARWKVRGSSVGPAGGAFAFFGPGLLRRPEATGVLLVVDVVPTRRIAFQLVDDRIEAELQLDPVETDRTRVSLAVEGGWGSIRKSFPHVALSRLDDLVQTSAER